MAEQLLDFDRSGLRPEDCVISWKEIASELSISEDTLQRWCATNAIKLPRWGPSTVRSQVFLPKSKVSILRQLYFR